MCNNLSFVDLSTNIGRLVLGRNNCIFQEVIDDFKDAEYIFISTFNISSNREELLNQLKQLENVTELIFLSNIPNRFDTYYSFSATKIAQGRISKYLSALDPKLFVSPTKVFFNFNNHSKIIMTNRVAYVGSANFSDESNNNFEIGVIIRDHNIINELRTIIVPQLLQESIRYAGDELCMISDSLNKFLANIAEALDNLDENLYIYDDHIPDRRIFDVHQAYVDKQSFDNLNNLIYEFEDYIMNDVLFIKYDSLREIEWVVLIDEVKDLLEGESIQKFLNFDAQAIMDKYLEDNALEAYEDKLESYCQKASEIAVEEKEKMANDIEAGLNLLTNSINGLQEALDDGLKLLWDIESAQTSIDNTFSR